MAVVEQHPSWLLLEHELVLEPDGQLETLPAGYVMHEDMSDVWQLMPPPPPPLLPEEDELHAVSVPANARPTSAASANPKS